ncbi:M15 family metallopeptidase [Paraglaciecola sp. L3A3]|uniref:M15 family metallopeptidase n=1 Tax=Paraglaciecola sp. L3A3 TaxID=2686358 RepID=UPI00131E1F53|nr:M15 family metallopeptidase [Paraglaciecola sp. L3A3]
MIPKSHIVGQDETLLVECQQGFKLLPKVCDAFQKMQRAAIKDGIDLQIVSSYRGFERQLLIWQNKWSGKTPVLDINETPLDISTLTDFDKACKILTWSALPGASRHHWGTDLDVYDKHAVEQSEHKFQLVCSEYEAEGPCAKLNIWLSEHAHEFGFTRPYHQYKGGIAAEPWHLSYSPIAEQIVAQLDLQTLQETIINSDIYGAEAVLTNLQTIFNRFVLNKGL